MFSLRSLRFSRLALPRYFHTVRPSYAMKESDISQDRDDLGVFYEAEKEDQVKASKAGKAKWKGELASNSEANVKADRGEVESDCRDFDEMQRKTKDLPNRKGPVNKTQ